MAKEYRVNFEELKAKASFHAVLSHYGLKPDRNGDQVKILCPFHPDKKPSCSVNLADGVFNCFGAGCDAEGNILEFVHRMENRGGGTVTLRQAGIRLAEICGIESVVGAAANGAQNGPRAARKRAAAETSPGKPAARPEASTGPGEHVSGREEPKANKPLGFALSLDPEHPYLRERGISPELVQTFGLGFCEKGSMAGRVCIPIHNAGGAIVAYAGRWVGPGEPPEGEDKYKLPKGFHKSLELFNLHRVKPYRHVVVVEGFFGAIRLHGERIPAVALMGGSVSDAQLQLLRDQSPNLRFVTVMLDGDEPGREAADAIATRLARHWWTRIAQLPDGEQPDTIDRAALEQLLGRGQER